MDLVSLVVILIIVGVLLWLVNSYIPMDGKIKQILNAVVVIAVVLWLLALFTGFTLDAPHPVVLRRPIS